MTEGFLGRWSKRKQESITTKALPEANAEQDAAQKLSASPKFANTELNNPSNSAIANTEHADAQEITLPNMSDVLSLTKESDFAPFVARNVSPEVRNAAMKKLFTDPHYNVMDRLDIYIDDYSKPDPLPLAMMRQLASAKFLNLFDEEENKEKSDIEEQTPEPVAKFESQETDLKSDVTIIEQEISQQKTHDHTDLRLRQDHAAEPHQHRR
ncbi:MAG TPA: DUF3306 domain-containing protein, partial [Burkholderiaceae bacterium]|nr:DUF3306 domain-containing protein [Burkholderiaceae bacterium]